MNTIFTPMNFKKTFFLFLFLFSYSFINAATYYLRNEGGNWNANTTWSTTSSASSTNTGTFPNSADIVIFNGNTNVDLTITANAACTSFTNLSETGVSLNLFFNQGTTLAVSGLFQITTTSGISRTTNVLLSNGATTANMTVGTHIHCGTSNASYTACENVMALSGPDITVSGNVNVFNNTNGSIHMRSMILHTAGSLKLIGTTVRTGATPTSGTGYLNTYQNSGNLSSNNKYQMSGTASLEFYHVGETPVYAQRAAENPPIFNGSTTTTVSYIENSTRATAGSVVYGSNYSKLVIDNDNGTNKVNTISGVCSVNELSILKGSINLTTTLTINSNGKINISSSGTSASGTNLNKCITAASATSLIYSGYVDITYSGNAIKAGLEIKTANANNTIGVNNVVLENTSSFDFGTGSIFFVNGSNSSPSSILKILQSVVINDNTFTLNISELNCPSISINGTNLAINSKLNASTNININGTTSATNTINAPIITLAGNGSAYNDLITSTTSLTVAGSTIFNGEINSPVIIVTTEAPCEFNNTLTNISFLTLNSDCVISNGQYISNTLTLGANLTNLGEVSTETLTISNDATLIPGEPATGVLKVLDLLTIESGKFLTTGGELVLVSNGNNTARVAPVHDNAIIGDVTVERYLPNLGRKWRLLTTPLKGTTNNTIYNNWQNNGSVDLQYLAGTDVWGPVDTYEYNTNGLDYIPLSTHNFRKFTNGAWTSISNSITEELFSSTKNNTFLTFIIAPAFAGVDKTNAPICEATSNSSATTLIAKGELIFGEQTYDVSGSTYHLIGNPYASPIDFFDIIDENGVNGNAIDPKIWILDPRIGSFGNYITWDQNVGISDTKATIHVNENSLIQSGQGFFVKRKLGNTSVPMIINENNKSSGNFNNTFGRTAARTINPNTQRIRVAVSKLEDNTDVHKDACVVGFYEGASNAVTSNDVQKFTNAAETLAFVNGNTSLSSEHRLPVANGDVLFIKLTNATTSNYKLKIHTENFAFTGEAVFHDLKLGTSMAMPLDGSVFEYPFDVTSDATTQGTRFKIVFNTTLGIDETADLLGIKVYPNPSTNSLGITLNTGNLELGNYEYKILNVLGQAVQDGKIENVQINQEIKIDFNNAITSGWYTIQILNNNKIVNSLPIIIK
ncbi:MAG: T9SS type A sorting domain-containing protein [Flavobacterium sp.]|nr:T9SS type A sorting domain-containing protein [Flavobacterium sp.]